MKLADWFDEVKERDWDAQMVRDFSPGGRGHHLVEQINRDIAEGKFTSFEEELGARRRQP